MTQRASHILSQEITVPAPSNNLVSRGVVTPILYNEPLLTTPPLWILALCASAMTCPILMWLLARQSHRGGRAVLSAILFFLGLATPWVIPSDLPWFRFFMTVPGFAVIGKNMEILHKQIDLPTLMASKGRFAAWTQLFPGGTWPDSPTAKQANQLTYIPTLREASGKLAAALALLALNSTVSLHDNLWLSCFWMCFVLYFLFSGLVDLLSLPFRIAGVDVHPVFNAPPLARSPRDFWSRRWNLWFTRTSNWLIFQPLGGSQHPLRSVSAVFIFSAVLHEYMVAMSILRFDGRMTAFFLLHGIATLATVGISKRLGRDTWMPRTPAVMLHIAWFALTAPLFFGPIDDLFHMTQWLLW